MDWDRTEKRGYDCSMKYSVTVDGQMLYFVYIVGLNGRKDSTTM
jgi:hypothetical protein